MTGDTSRAVVPWARPVISDSPDPIDIALSAIGLAIELRALARRIEELP